MNLSIDYSVKNKQITIILQTTEFTTAETKALDMMGEPVVAFQKTYPGGYIFSISKKIRSQFRIIKRIDGTSNFDLANEACTQFLTDIKDKLRDTMDDLMIKYEGQIFPSAKTIENITSY